GMAVARRAGEGGRGGERQFCRHEAVERHANAKRGSAKRLRRKGTPRCSAGLPSCIPCVDAPCSPADDGSQFPSKSLLTISRITSLVPSRIWCTRTSRKTRSIG